MCEYTRAKKLPFGSFVLDRLYHLLFSVRMSGNCLPALFIKSSVCLLHSSSVPSKIARHGLKSSRTEWVGLVSISLFSMNLSYHMGWDIYRPTPKKVWLFFTLPNQRQDARLLVFQIHIGPLRLSEVDGSTETAWFAVDGKLDLLAQAEGVREVDGDHVNLVIFHRIMVAWRVGQRLSYPKETWKKFF